MRQFRTYGSVGALGGRPPRATRFAPYRTAPSREMEKALRICGSWRLLGVSRTFLLKSFRRGRLSASRIFFKEAAL